MRRPGLQHLGMWVLVLSTVGVLAAITAATLIKLAADDMALTVAAANRGADADHAEPGNPLAGWLASDLPASDTGALSARGRQLTNLSERIREAAYVGAVVGLLVAVLTTRSRPDATARGASSPVAKTTSNGMA